MEALEQRSSRRRSQLINRKGHRNLLGLRGGGTH
jgi:hypothetical protein